MEFVKLWVEQGLVLLDWPPTTARRSNSTVPWSTLQAVQLPATAVRCSPQPAAFAALAPALRNLVLTPQQSLHKRWLLRLLRLLRWLLWPQLPLPPQLLLCSPH